jgi:hypothetical protein
VSRTAVAAGVRRAREVDLGSCVAALAAVVAGTVAGAAVVGHCKR